MLFENALDIHSNVQNIPHRDLATLRSPRSRYTFMNYLHENGLLLEHLNMDLMMPMRPDFAAYIKWCVEQLSEKVSCGKNVRSIEMLDDIHNHVYRIETHQDDVYFARHVVIGTGRSPLIPAVFKPAFQSDRVFHLSTYQSSLNRLLEKGAKKIAVVGSSQSEVEILLHLSKFEPRLEIHSIFRRFGYPLKDTNPFMSEIYFPEFTDLYYAADQPLKTKIDRDVIRTNYGACDMDVLEELYRQIYYDKLHKKNQIHIKRMSSIQGVKDLGRGIEMAILNDETGETSAEIFDGVILATGFRNIGAEAPNVQIPDLLSGVVENLALDADGCVAVSREYTVRFKPAFETAGELVLNGLCETSHGMGDAGSVSLLSLRAQTIADKLLERDG